uniref:Uncharacterized protein n=1 Tax=Oreochromis niloticus TaxID=8128 RepID=A0A669EEV2_ORENI
MTSAAPQLLKHRNQLVIPRSDDLHRSTCIGVVFSLPLPLISLCMCCLCLSRSRALGSVPVLEASNLPGIHFKSNLPNSVHTPVACFHHTVNKPTFYVRGALQLGPIICHILTECSSASNGLGGLRPC